MPQDTASQATAPILSAQEQHDENLLTPRYIGRFNAVGFWTLFSKEVYRFMKVYGQTIIAPVVTTVLYYLVFTLAFGDIRKAIGGVEYMLFLMPGLIMMTMAQNAFMNSSSALMISKYDGSIVDLLMPPLSNREILGAKVLGGAMRGLVVGTASTLTFLVLSDMSFYNPFYIFFHAVAGSMFLSTMGLMTGIWAEKFDHTAAVTNFLVTPMTFLSGTFYSIDQLSDKWQPLVVYNPFFYMIDGFRYGFIGYADSNLAAGIIVMLVMNVVFLYAAYRMLKSGYKLKS
ncbi:MAG: ABC transporter permease [Pseudomonadota bacterium]